MKEASTFRMYRAMVGVGLMCGLAIVSIYEFTKPVIARNRAEALQRAIFQVLPDARSSSTFVYTADGAFAPLAEDGGAADAGPVVHAGYDGDGALVGFAVEAEGMGYADLIRILYGYAPDRDAVVGFQVLESKETPGLGDRISKDPAFLENFRGLDVTLATDGSAPANPIVTVKNGTKTHAWEVDGITGATISSVAVGDMLRASTTEWIARLAAGRDRFAGGPS